MKSSYTKTTKTTTSYTKVDNKSKYQPKSITQTVKTIDTSKYTNKKVNPPSNTTKTAPKPLSSYTRPNQKTQNQSKPATQTGKINIDMSKYMKNRANTTTNLAKREEKPKYQINRNVGGQKQYDRRNMGNTQTKVETMQDGDYLIKVTTTRKVVEKGDYDNRYGTGNNRGAYGRK